MPGDLVPEMDTLSAAQLPFDMGFLPGGIWPSQLDHESQCREMGGFFCS